MPDFDLDAALAEPPREERAIAVAYAVYSFDTDGEEVEEDRGWLHSPDHPICMEPDEFDVAEGRGVANLAVDFLRGEGATEASASHFHAGVWYIAREEMNVDGQVHQKTYHLRGFTPEEELCVFRRMVGNRRIAGRLDPARDAW